MKPSMTIKKGSVKQIWTRFELEKHNLEEVIVVKMLYGSGNTKT